MLPQLTLVLGGAASGKSVFAERLSALTGRPRTYVATATPGDDEMSAKIARHQARRVGWRNVEAPLELAGALGQIEPGQVVLVDCATMWLANHLAEDADVGELVLALNRCASPVIMVSNELGQGIVPDNALARRFRQVHGEMNQKFAAESGLVVMVTARLPLVLKGDMPKGAV